MIEFTSRYLRTDVKGTAVPHHPQLRHRRVRLRSVIGRLQ